MSELREFKCPNCDGRLEFDSHTQKLKCPYCDGTFDPDSFEDAKEFVVDNSNWDDSDLVTYTCNSCNGVIMADKNTAASSCPYCNNPVVMSGNVSGVLKPKKILPFLLDKDQAKQKYKQHLKGKILLPRAFKSDATIDEIKGIYVPYWIFDGKAKAKMWFDATKTRTWNEGDYTMVETSYYKLYRSGSVRFSKVPVDASSKVDDDITQSIEPFNYQQSKDFNQSYLAGYFADKYDVDVEESREVANKRISNSTKALFASTTATYDSVVPSASSIEIGNGNQEYVMYPVWLLNVKYKDKYYTFAMNGQTGKFVGDLPEEKGKLAFLSIGIFLGVMSISTLIQYLLYIFG